MDFNELAKSYGPGIALLAIVGPAVWKALTWTAENVVRPLTARHIQFVDEMAKSHQGNTEALTKLAQAQTSQVENEKMLVELAKTKMALMIENKDKVHEIISLLNKPKVDTPSPKA